MGFVIVHSPRRRLPESNPLWAWRMRIPLAGISRQFPDSDDRTQSRSLLTREWRGFANERELDLFVLDYFAPQRTYTRRCPTVAGCFSKQNTVITPAHATLAASTRQ